MSSDVLMRVDIHLDLAGVAQRLSAEQAHALFEGIGKVVAANGPAKSNMHFLHIATEPAP